MGIPHPRYLGRYLTAQDLAEWQAFNTISPIGAERQDYLFALLAWVMARSNGNKRVKLANMMPKWGRTGAKTEMEMMAGFAANAEAAQRRTKRKK